jgi:hypothetical protein
MLFYAKNKNKISKNETTIEAIDKLNIADIKPIKAYILNLFLAKINATGGRTDIEKKDGSEYKPTALIFKICSDSACVKYNDSDSTSLT